MRALAVALLLSLPLAQGIALPEAWAHEGPATWTDGGLTCEGVLAARSAGALLAGEREGEHYLLLDVVSETPGCPDLHREGWIERTPREDSAQRLAPDAWLFVETADDGSRAVSLLEWTPRSEVVDLVLVAPIG